MKKEQATKFVIGGLAALLALIVGTQLPGGETKRPTAAAPTVQATVVARHTGDSTEPVVVRDAFWHPALAKDQPVSSSAPAVPEPSPTAAMTLPRPTLDTAPPEIWIPPVRPDVTGIEIGPKADGEKAEAPQPEAIKPKKVLSVCGFLATQTPKIILSLDSEDPTPYGKGEKPCAEITILEIKMDEATLQLPGRKIKVTAGQQVEI